MDEPRKIPVSTDCPRGSMYTTALVDKLTHLGATNEPLIDPEGDDELTDVQDGLIEGFTNAVYDYLVTNIDCRTPEQGLTFPSDQGATENQKIRQTPLSRTEPPTKT